MKMKKCEFKLFLNDYKNFKDFISNLFKEKFPEEELDTFYIRDGKIIVLTKSEMNFDITKEVLADLMPDNLVF